MNQLQQPPIETQIKTPTRRDFLNRAALTVTAVGATALARPVLAQAPAATAPADAVPAANPKPDAMAMAMAKKADMLASDLAILGFALGLERLEAAFYAQIQGAHQKRAYLSPKLLKSAQEIGAIEILHVTTLETAILAAGGSLQPNPTHRFPANVFISPVAFGWFGYTLEEIGIGAYLGAVGQINSPDLRKAAASIYGSEVRHAAILRSLGGFSFAPRYFESPLTVEQVTELVKPYIA